jgi:hypothetical protein
VCGCLLVVQLPMAAEFSGVWWFFRFGCRCLLFSEPYPPPPIRVGLVLGSVVVSGLESGLSSV